MSEQGFSVNQDNYPKRRKTSDELFREANESCIARNNSLIQQDRWVELRQWLEVIAFWLILITLVVKL